MILYPQTFKRKLGTDALCNFNLSLLCSRGVCNGGGDENEHTQLAPSPTNDEDQRDKDNWLRAHLGDEKFQWMQELQARGHLKKLYELAMQQPEAPPPGNVNTIGTHMAYHEAYQAWF